MNKWLALPQPMRALMAPIGFVCALACIAQKPIDLDYTIKFAAQVSTVQSKFIYEGLRSQDPSALIWIDTPTDKALVRTIVHLDQTELQTAIASSGAVIVEMGVIGHTLSQLKKGTGNSSNDLAPVYKDTGDPAQDNVRYEIAKREWIAAHPDGSQKLSAPVPEQ